MRFLSLIFIFVLTACGGNSSGYSELSPSLSSRLSRYDIPGIAAAVIENKELKELSVQGIRKMGHPALLTTEDKFHLGSCTKAMTATLAAILVEENKLSWNSTLRELLPEYDLHPDYHQVSFDMLLAHRSGLRRDTENLPGDWLYRELYSQSSVNGRKLYAQTVLSLPADYSPGSKFGYSNGGYMLAALILEKLTGQSWETLMREKIFIPLNMKSCGFGAVSLPGEFIPSSPWGHIRRNGELMAVHSDNPPAFAPASSVHCSLSDWGKFLMQHVEGFNGGNGLIKADSFKKLHTLYPAADSTYTYGGWGRYDHRWPVGPVLTHNGTNTMNYALVWLAPQRELIIMSTANAAGSEGSSAVEEVVNSLITQRTR